MSVQFLLHVGGTHAELLLQPAHLASDLPFQVRIRLHPQNAMGRVGIRRLAGDVASDIRIVAQPRLAPLLHPAAPAGCPRWERLIVRSTLTLRRCIQSGGEEPGEVARLRIGRDADDGEDLQRELGDAACVGCLPRLLHQGLEPLLPVGPLDRVGEDQARADTARPVVVPPMEERGVKQARLPVWDARETFQPEAMSQRVEIGCC